MGDDPTHFPGMLEPIRTELTAVETRRNQDRTECDRRDESMAGFKAMAIANRERLITVAGERGTNGKLGELRRDVGEMQDEHKAMRKSGAIGGSAGAGLVVLVVEILRHFAG